MITRILKLYTIKEILTIGFYFLKKRAFPSSFQHEYFLIKKLNIKKEKNFLIFSFKISITYYSFYLEKNSSDSQVFNQIILNEEYNKVLELINTYDLPIFNMIDAGSNIGLTSIYFNSYFPNLNIIALEPNQQNFNKMNTNIKKNNLKTVKILNNALYGKRTLLSEGSPYNDGKDWSFRLVENSDITGALNEYEALDISSLMNDFNLDIIDFLKMDIEGGEFSVFEYKSDLTWLNKTRLLAIEIHEDCGSKTEIQNILKDYNYELFYSGELTIGLNKLLLNNLNY